MNVGKFIGCGIIATTASLCLAFHNLPLALFSSLFMVVICADGICEQINKKEKP